MCVTHDRLSAGFWDSASWDSVKRQGQEAIEKWIDRQLENTSVTVVLIVTETSYTNQDEDLLCILRSVGIRR